MVPIAPGNLLVPFFGKVQTTPKFLRKLLPASFRSSSRQLIGSENARQFIGSNFSKKYKYLEFLRNCCRSLLERTPPTYPWWDEPKRILDDVARVAVLLRNKVDGQSLRCFGHSHTHVHQESNKRSHDSRKVGY